MISLMRFSATNLALGYIALSIAVLILFATPLGIAWNNGIDDARTERLQQDVQLLTDIFSKRGAQGVVAEISSTLNSPFAVGRITFFSDASLSRLAGNLPVWPPEIPSSPGTYRITIDRSGILTPVSFVHSILPGGYHLLIGREIARFKNLENLFWYALASAAVAVLSLGWLGGMLIRHALLSELKNISQTASAIVGGNLSRRLPVQNSGTELNILKQTLNRMLDQIEQLVHGVRNVSNAIAHDLRTPLAELRSRLEELSIVRPGTEETFTEIDAAVEDVDRVIGIFNALLRLAEIDTGARRSGFVQVDVTKVAGEAAEFYRPVAELNGARLFFESSGELAVAGDPLLLAQAIGNLIDNALKYAPQNGSITVQVQRSNSNIAVSVSDNGPGISDNDKPKVAERFYRGDASRCTPGVGLGLSLVAAVAKLHEGSLELSDNHPGLRATLIFGVLRA